MNYKKLIFVSILLFVLSVTAVSATDLDDNYVTESVEVDDSLEIQNSEILSDSPGTFEDLQAEINNAPAGSVLNLTRDYNGHEGAVVNLNKDLTIDGQGHTINCLNAKGCRAINSNNGTITLKNLRIINANDPDTMGVGTITISGSAQYTIENCTFEKNYAKSISAIRNSVDKTLTIKNSTFNSNTAKSGGAIYSNGKIIVENSVFDSCKGEDSDSTGGAIHIHSGGIIENSIFKNNFAGYNGGAISSYGDLDIDHCYFENNKVDGQILHDSYGGAISCSKALYIDNSTFKDNWADDYGGAIAAQDLYINYYQDANQPLNTFFINNVADDTIGGAIHCWGNFNMKNTVLSSNKAYVDGGAAYARKDVTISNCLFESNRADGATSQCYGGAVRCEGNVYVDNSTFKGNYAHDYGGAIYASNIYVNNYQDNNRDYNSFFINNVADDNDGGALYSYYNTYVKNAEFTGNSAYEDGGAIFCCDNAYITNSYFNNNEADGASSAQCEGGAIFCKDDLTVEKSTFSKNYAHDYGGAIYADTLALKPYCSFYDNKAYDNQGGAIRVNKFRENVQYAVFYNNHAGEGAKDDGGAIYINNANTVTFSQCAFIINQCGDEGGAIYLDSTDSHLTLWNNFFLGNTAGDEGQVVFNKGHYDSISDNWWGDNLPSKNNDLLIEWKLIWSNEHHVDANPVYLKLMLSEDTTNVGTPVWATTCFYRYDGKVCNNLFYNELIDFLPTTNIEFGDKYDHGYYMNTLLTPKAPGLYSIYANLFGQLTSDILSVSGNSKLAASNIANEPIPPLFDEDIITNNGDSNIVSSNREVNTGNTNIKDNNDVNDEVSNTTSTDKNPANNSVAKAIDNQPNGSDNNLWWIILAVVAIIAAGAIIKKYKS